MGIWVVIQVVLAVISVAAAITAKKQIQNKEDRAGISLNRFGVNNAIPVVLGTREISPIFVYQGLREEYNVDPKNEHYYGIMVWCVGEIEEITNIYMDDLPIADFGFIEQTVTSDQGDLHYTNNEGNQAFTTYYGKDDQINLPDWFRSGTGGLPGDPGFIYAVPDDMADVEFRGLCVSFIKFTMDNEFKRYPQGLPQFRATIKGKKILNLRTGLSDSTSTNPFDQLSWYLKDASVGKDEQFVTNDANILANSIKADQLVNTPDGDVKLKTSNIIIDTGLQIFDSVESLLDDNGIFPIETDSGIGFIIDEDRPIDMIILESELIGGIESSGLDLSERYNMVVLKYPDENNRYQINEVRFPDVNTIDGAALYNTWRYDQDDGIDLKLEIEVDSITNIYLASQKAEMLGRASREGKTVKIKIGAKGWKLETLDIIALNSTRRGWINKAFSVREISYDDDGVSITALEFQPSVYPWSGKTQADDYDDTILRDPFDIENVSNLTFSSLPDDLNYAGKLFWNAPQGFVLYYIVRIIDQNDITILKQEVYDTKLNIDNLVAGDYTFQVTAYNDYAVSGTETLLISLVSPAVPTVNFVINSLELTIIPAAPGTSLSTTFELLFGSTNNFNDAINFGKSSSWTITGLRSITTYYYWVRTINPLGASAYLSGSVTTIADGSAIVELIGADVAAEILPDVISAVEPTIVQEVTDQLVGYPTTVQAQVLIDDAIDAAGLSDSEEFRFGVIDSINDIFNNHSVDKNIKTEIYNREVSSALTQTNVDDNTSLILTVQDSITSLDSAIAVDILALGVRVGDNEAGLINVNQAIIDEAGTRVSQITTLQAADSNILVSIAQIEIDIDGNTTSINGVTSTINNPTSGLSATFGLVQQAQTDANNNASAITALQTSVNNPTSGLSATFTLAGEAKTDADNNASAITALQTSVNNPTSGLSATFTLAGEAKTDADNNASAITALQTSVNNPTSGLSATFTLAGEAKTDADNNASAITALQTSVNNPTSGLSATFTLAGEAKTDADNNASAIGQINARIDGVDVDVEANLTLYTSLDTSLDEYRASAQLAVDVDGTVSFIQLDATPSASQIKFQTNQIFFLDALGNPKVYWDLINERYIWDGTIFAENIEGDVTDIDTTSFEKNKVIGVAYETIFEFTIPSATYDRTLTFLTPISVKTANVTYKFQIDNVDQPVAEKYENFDVVPVYSDGITAGSGLTLQKRTITAGANRTIKMLGKSTSGGQIFTTVNAGVIVPSGATLSGVNMSLSKKGSGFVT